MSNLQDKGCQSGFSRVSFKNIGVVQGFLFSTFQNHKSKLNYDECKDKKVEIQKKK